MSSILDNNVENIYLSHYEKYPDGQLKNCVFTAPVSINTPYGVLIPQFEHTGIRRKHTYSVSYSQDGILTRVVLNDQTEIYSPIGYLPAELITFYESGKIKKIFPLNGQLSGYWDEDDEFKLAKDIIINLPCGSNKIKFISISFYENGEISSVTLWPKEMIEVNTPFGKQKIKSGISFYPGGNIKSFEPAVPIDIVTHIGVISAFDINSNGMSGDKNSVFLSEDGSLKSLITSSNKIKIVNQNGKAENYSPISKYNIFYTLKIAFDSDTVIINDTKPYLITENQFTIEPYNYSDINKCIDCTNCHLCSN
jgi:hypothetical protein